MKVYAIVDGIEYDLNYGDPAKFEGEDDLGMPDLHRLDERGPMQHGSTDRGYRLDPRYPTYVFGITAMSRAQLWDRRAELLRIFRPSQSIIMKHVLENDDVRYLDCVVSGGMKMPAQDRRAGIFQKAAVVLKADDPTFYDPTGKNKVFTIGAGPDLMAVPTVIPMTVGASTINVNVSIIYAGGYSVFPRIRITGPIHDCVITHTTFGDKLDFTGTTIDDGHYYDIDLRYGYKTIIDNHGVNKFSGLTSDSDLTTFHLGCDPEVPGGINSITVTGSVATELTGVSFTWNDRYLGI
jgi:hypothetical protein